MCTFCAFIYLELKDLPDLVAFMGSSNGILGVCWILVAGLSMIEDASLEMSESVSEARLLLLEDPA